MTDRTWYVYILIDPRTYAVRYVGWSFDAAKRLRSHLCPSRTKGTHKGHWLRELLTNGLRPTIQIVEFGNGDWAACERKWISHFRGRGEALTNLTDGGDGTPGHYPTAETRRKMSLARIGRKRSPESIAKTAAGLRGKPKSPEHIAKMSAANKGNKSQAIATAAAAVVNRGRKQSAEHIAKRIAPHVGRPHKCRKLTDDQVRQIRALRGTVALRKLASMFGVGQTVIHSIHHRYRYVNVPD